MWEAEQDTKAVSARASLGSKRTQSPSSFLLPLPWYLPPWLPPGNSCRGPVPGAVTRPSATSSTLAARGPRQTHGRPRQRPRAVACGPGRPHTRRRPAGLPGRPPPSEARSLLPGSRPPRPSPPPSPGLSAPPPPPARFRGRLPQEKGGGPPRLRGPRPCRPRPAATAGSRSSTPGRALVTCRHPASRREEARPRDRRPALRARRSSQRPGATQAASPASPPSSAERVTETWASVRSCSSRPPRPSLLLRSAR